MAERINMNLAEKIIALGDRAKTMSLDEIADAVDMTEEDRIGFKTSAVASQRAWAEVKTGLPCDCGKTMHFTGTKITKSVNQQGFDVFLFECDCGRRREREWRAPSLDGRDFPAYRVQYEFGDDESQQ